MLLIVTLFSLSVHITILYPRCLTQLQRKVSEKPDSGEMKTGLKHLILPLPAFTSAALPWDALPFRTHKIAGKLPRRDKTTRCNIERAESSKQRHSQTFTEFKSRTHNSLWNLGPDMARCS